MQFLENAGIVIILANYRMNNTTKTWMKASLLRGQTLFRLSNLNLFRFLNVA